MTRIESIAGHLNMIPVIAKWHWDEWGHADPTGSLASWTAGLNERTRRDGIPTMWIALADNNVPIGSVVLVENDMDTHLELTPWLAGLFVLPEYRGQGIGGALTRRAMDFTAMLGIQQLYLYTATATALYQRLGWSILSQEYYEDEPVDVMQFRFSATAITE